MPSKVILECIEGDLSGSRFAYGDREVCIVGRSPECRPVLPNDDAHLGISRHHCLIDINPPAARVRDFGSLNGTFVNGKAIGRRDKGLSPEAARDAASPEYDLKHGDVLQLGGTAFRVLLECAIHCTRCGEEVGTVEGNLKRRAAPVLCGRCHTRAETVRSHAPVGNGPACIACNEPVIRSGSWDAFGQTQLCQRCRNNSDRILDYAARLEGLSEMSTALGRYKVFEKLGHGGMGAVYRAEDKTTGEVVALKVLLPEVAINNKNVDLFLRESDVSRMLEHPNVVKLFDSGYESGIFYLCMRYCNGGSVEQRIEEAGGRLPLTEAIEITLQVLEALDYAHNRVIKTGDDEDGTCNRVVGIVHRDVKPKNILLNTTDGKTTALLCDFGLSKAFDLAGLSGLTCTGSVAGSPVYMPRQQIVNFKYSRPEVDVWATAASLYHMLTGTFPRNFENQGDPWRIVLETSAIPIRKRNPDVPDAIATVIDRALIDRPDIRVKSARELYDRLAAAAGH